MSMVEIHLLNHRLFFSNQCITQRSRLRILLYFTDNKDNFGVLFRFQHPSRRRVWHKGPMNAHSDMRRPGNLRLAPL
jgi:hypothetical protein